MLQALKDLVTENTSTFTSFHPSVFTMAVWDHQHDWVRQSKLNHSHRRLTLADISSPYSGLCFHSQSVVVPLTVPVNSIRGLYVVSDNKTLKGIHVVDLCIEESQKLI